ncbi:hypothetical protein L5C75_28580, partial [Pseudomonas aeruginosa]|nr:hypothetical protein [Pseudomonas aeruginosa]
MIHAARSMAGRRAGPLLALLLLALGSQLKKRSRWL